MFLGTRAIFAAIRWHRFNTGILKSPRPALNLGMTVYEESELKSLLIKFMKKYIKVHANFR